MSVLDRSELASSPLADLHLIAAELGLDGFRRLRKDDIVEAIVARQGGGAPSDDEPETAEAEPEAADADVSARGAEDAGGSDQRRARGGARSGRPRRRRRDPDSEDAPAPAQRSARGAEAEPSHERTTEGVVEGVIEVLANGSGFVRLNPVPAGGGTPEPSEDDAYVSAAQVRRCELVTGDRVSGPQRGPRRSERYPSLIRVDAINGRPADEVADGVRFEELPCTFPTDRFAFDSDDATLKALEWLTPVGKGSRVVIAGPTRAGKTEALRRMAGALAGREGLELSVVLAGVRPEELADWAAGPIAPASAVSFAASPDTQGQAIENVLEQARRVAARGGDAVVFVDTLAALPAGAARRVLAAARNILDGGSLTVIATTSEPVGGETTVITLDRDLTAAGRFPALDFLHSGTLRAELLVGQAGAEAIARARAQSAE